MTGFATLAGISFEKMDWYGFAMFLVIPLSFLAGVMFSGYLTQKQFAHYRHGQRYAPGMQIVAFLLLAVVIEGHFNFFGVFGNLENIKHDYLLSIVLCTACGLQNGAITLASGATIRTTHLTGITTDIGLGIIRSEVTQLSKNEQKKERRANLLKAGQSAFNLMVFLCQQQSQFIFPM